MRRPNSARWLSLVAMPLLGLSVCADMALAQQEARGKDFYIVNNGTGVIEQAFVSLTGARNWGQDRLGREPIPMGESRLIRDTLSEGCQGDVRVVFANGEQMERRNQNLCRINKMFFNSPAPSNRRLLSPDISIRNGGERPIEKLYVTRSGARDWGQDRLGKTGEIGPRDRRSISLGKDFFCQIDIRANFSGGQDVEYHNAHICADPAVVFFAPDTDVARLNAQPGGGPDGQPGTGQPGAGLGHGTQVAGSAGNVTVLNAYRVPLRELFVFPSEERGRGNDHLPDGVRLGPNERYAVQIDTTQECQFDIRAVWENEVEQMLRAQNLCASRTLALRGPPPGEKMWSGTGFYVSGAGHVVTNRHVVHGCAKVVVAHSGIRNVPLQLIGMDTEHDLALLQEAAEGTPAVTFRAGANPLRAGEPSISLGYPIRELLGSLIVTTGIVSSLSGGRGNEALFQMQTPIQPGNSGGPVFDETGLLIGVTSAQITRAGTRVVQNVNFAVKSEVARRFLESQGLKMETARPGPRLTPADITEQRQKSVLPLTCYN